ncbi:Serpin-Z1 [Dichanthelium oligosanthes]|uniref:Serpin-Z1 n=1 Tax=Dichanthelium oligosanthes TaxID=888268 RepID=A0A1E5W4M7_9POAL|nr:Serpin-Z1 [Dichanthelium oligosanthes]
MCVLRHLASSDDSSCTNLAVSPLSLHAALALLAAGARGATLDEIADFLGPAGGRAHATLASYVATRVLADGGGGGEGGLALGFANGVWIDADLQLQASFARVAAEQYRLPRRGAPGLLQTHAGGGEEPDQPVDRERDGRPIKDLLPAGSLHHGSPAVLANALYFKDAWQRRFDACLTRDEAFFLHDDGYVRVPFMSNTSSKLYIACRPGYKVLRLPYARGGAQCRLCSMYIYLPDAHDGLQSLLDKLSADPALLESSGTLADEVPVRAFRVPKFTVSYKTNLTEMLRDLGLLLRSTASPLTSLTWWSGRRSRSSCRTSTTGPWWR